jgi:hypothetical protein
MKNDPATGLETLKRPPTRGRGSSREAWMEYTYELEVANHGLTDLIRRQSETIRDLEAEITLLRRQIGARKPKGGRPTTAQERVNAVEAELAGGVYTIRAIAVRNGVSPMTVSRISARMAARAALAGAADRS